MGRGSFFTLQIHNSRNWHTLPDLVTGLETIRTELGLVALQVQPVEIGEHRSRLPIGPTDLLTYCQANYHVKQEWDRQDFVALYPEGRLYIDFRVSLISGTQDVIPISKDLPILMRATKYGSFYNRLNFSVILSPRTVPEADLTLKYGEIVIQLYVSIAQTLISALAPDYVWIAEDDEYEDHVGGRDVLAHRFDTIYWANYFGPGYLSQDVEELFLTAPVGIVRRLGGGLWYQLHEHFETVPEQAVEEIEEQIKAHFKVLKLNRVQWRYTIY